MDSRLASRYVWSLVADMKKYSSTENRYPKMLVYVYQKWSRELEPGERMKLREYVESEVATCRLKKALSEK